ncbi:lysozyme inhibitor LprI family protein [Leptolyngbya boryana CZ1]|uniref:Lysozyme inhibitor LprI family protein n=1 Tax=Leptolyngbya boryana CZ1 TaxID=3060204 RepID=A0AA96WYJ2_LEPBY|nr:lysozyme inhibitor LprI family protein [Leptolyngbya boryana]WNZ47691.1 lysozyme inhibitor LprI family protein [Leptolyngbya boryana CZ1]
MQRKLIALVMIGVMSAISQHATAQNKPTPSENLPRNIRVDCKNQQTQFDMNFCANQQARAADRKLNQAYQKLIRSYKGSRRESQLVAAQQAWIKFRDTNCTFTSAAYEGGSIQPMVYSNCIEKMTNDRTKQLEDFAKNREGVF